MSALFSFSNIYRAYRQCLRGKQKTRNAQRYQLQLLDNLWETLWQLQQYRWTLGHAIFFIALKPKVREIHAADFSDRVVHHLIVPEIEALFEPVFIFDCYSNHLKGNIAHQGIKIIPRWQPLSVSSLKSQWRYFKKLNPAVLLIIQVGYVYKLYDKDAHFLSHYLR